MENKDLTLLIMAAGMGSRFGGLKQIEPMGPNGEFLIDYSIYDAIRVGFNKVVFIIKEENYDLFKDTIGKRIEDKIKTEYVFQDINDLPLGYTKPEEREKPWGTAHAILCAKNNINEPFAIINADDFYGYDAYYVVSEFLKNDDSNNYCLIGYKVGNTLTENGSVKRGICKVEKGYLKELIESKVSKENGIITASPLDGSKSFKVNENDNVSMNMLGFTPSIFRYLEKKFPEFLDSHKEDILTCEYLIPDVLQMAVEEGFATTKVIPTTAEWKGVTYKEDKEDVVKSLKLYIDKGDYPRNLWK